MDETQKARIVQKSRINDCSRLWIGLCDMGYEMGKRFHKNCVFWQEK